jgi:hypothetical protein
MGLIVAGAVFLAALFFICLFIGAVFGAGEMAKNAALLRQQQKQDRTGQ